MTATLLSNEHLPGVRSRFIDPGRGEMHRAEIIRPDGTVAGVIRYLGLRTPKGFRAYGWIPLGTAARIPALSTKVEAARKVLV